MELAGNLFLSYTLLIDLCFSVPLTDISLPTALMKKEHTEVRWVHVGANLHITTRQEYTPDDGTGVDTMMIWFFSCTPSSMTDTGSAEDNAALKTHPWSKPWIAFTIHPLHYLFRKLLQ